MLNSLFFEGRTILPKAATPMTAALTTLSYGEKFSAHVEFYTQDDISKIQERAQIYEQRLREKEKQYFDEMRSRLKRDKEKTEKTVPNDSEIEEMANKKAKKDMQKNISLDAAHDQAERIRNSGIDVRNLEGRAVFRSSIVRSSRDCTGSFKPGVSMTLMSRKSSKGIKICTAFVNAMYWPSAPTYSINFPAKFSAELALMTARPSKFLTSIPLLRILSA